MANANVKGKIVFSPDEDFSVATAYIRLVDVSKQDAPSEIIGEQILRNISHKVGEETKFSLSREIRDLQGFYIVSIHIDIDRDREVSIGDYITTGYYPVVAEDSPTEITVLVKKVTS